MIGEAFCKACDDTGWLYHHGEERELACPDCPLCACGEPLGSHVVIDLEGELVMKPREVFWLEGFAYAPSCWEELWAARRKSS